MTKRLVGILDYGINNIASIYNSLKKLENIDIRIIKQIIDLKDLRHLIIPGVGSFNSGISNLEKKGFINEIVNFSKNNNNYLLGVCLGAQLLFEESEENNEKNNGLSIFKGDCKLLTNNKESIKVPHMGWNQVNFQTHHEIFDNIPDNFYAYFVHSYYIKPMDKKIILGKTLHGINFPSVIGNRNNLGMQFHPEKSGKIGLKLLENFIKL
mgnify:CR=1 FL=1